MIITHNIFKEAEGTYYTLPFEVPQGQDKIRIKYTYKKSKGILSLGRNASIVDIGLIDADGIFMGWSGSARKEITVGEFFSTPGYFRKKIKPGIWHIIAGAYKIKAPFTEITYEIDFPVTEKRFYYGDMHMHSTASDGKYSHSELGSKALGKGLDFIAVSDHNNCSENFRLPEISGLTFIPAVEWTHYKGHMNFYGIPAPFGNSFIANSDSEMRELIKRVKAAGAAVSVNHPKCPLCPYLWDSEDFDMLEIINGPMRGTNRRALEYWTSLLKKGRKIPVVGGSDFHDYSMPIRIGHPVTAVWAENAGGAELMNEIRKGHSFVALSKKSVKIMLKCGDKMMGDTVSPGTAEVIAENTAFCRLYAVTAKGEKEIRGNNIKIDFSEEDRFLYIKAVKRFSPKGSFCCVTNPLYIE